MSDMPSTSDRDRPLRLPRVTGFGGGTDCSSHTAFGGGPARSPPDAQPNYFPVQESSTSDAKQQLKSKLKLKLGDIDPAALFESEENKVNPGFLKLRAIRSNRPKGPSLKSTLQKYILPAMHICAPKMAKQCKQLNMPAIYLTLAKTIKRRQLRIKI